MTILAGGIGSRFWPVSTRDRPKQLLPLGSERPLIVDTVERARTLVPDRRIRILAGEHLAAPFRSVLTDLSEDAYWVEPRARGTAPVLAWAAWKLAKLDPDAVMVSLHADHIVHPDVDFQDTIRAAVEIARRDHLLLSLGVPPDRVETGYGHIETGEPIMSGHGVEAFRVHAFHEKPDAETARRYVDAGYLWNTGIFVWKASVLLTEIERYAPEITEHLPLLEGADSDFFDAVPVSVIDRVVMERSDRVGVVRAAFSWDDVGSWEALSRTREADAQGNVVLGNGRLVDSTDNIVFSDEGSVVVFGAANLIVVRSGDTTMVLPRDRAPELKSLLERMAGESE